MTGTKFEVEIISPQSVLYSGEAEGVFVPGSKGPFEILVNHAPIVSSLDAGIVRIVSSGEKDQIFAVGTGFTEVRNNKVAVIVSEAVERSEINKSSVEKSIADLDTKIRDAKSPEEIVLLKKKLDYAKQQLKAASMAE